MSFNEQKFYKIDVGFSAGSGVPNLYKYQTSESRATTLTSGYFPESLNLKSNDYIYCVSEDGPQMIYVVTTSPVTVADLVDEQVDIPTNSVGTAQLKTDAVATDKIQNLAVVSAKLADEAVTNSKLAPNSVVAGKIAASAVSSSDIASGAVTSAKLGAGIASYIAFQASSAASTATSTTINVTGVLATDKAYACLTAGFTQPVTGVTCAAGAVTVHFAAATTAADTIEVWVTRAIS